MKNTKEEFIWYVARMISLVLVASPLTFCQVPDAVYPTNAKPAPATVQPEILVITESLVEKQWRKSLSLVTLPTDLKSAWPSQCVRFGVIATGDDRDRLLQNSMLSFGVRFAGRNQTFAADQPAVIKQLKPEGGDFVTAALSVAGIRNPFPSMATLAVSTARWCVPLDAQDGAADVTGDVTDFAAKSISLPTRSIQVRTFETARKQVPFKDDETLSAWLQHYHAEPDPALLLPAIRFVASREKLRSMPNVGIFFIEALKACPPASNELLQRLAKEDRAVRLYTMPLLSQAGFLRGASWERLTSEERVNISSNLLPDPFDAFYVGPHRDLMNRLEMLWGIFFATGDLKPVQMVVRMLSWHDHYTTLTRLIESGQRPTEVTENLMRGAMYRGAGWSLKSLSLEDGLLADYIDYLKSAPETPEALKQELTSLNTNPAFDLK